MDEYKKFVMINLTAQDLCGQIAEARIKLDRWLMGVPPPPARSNMVQALRLVKINPLRYELTHVPRTNDTESRTIF